MKVLIILLRLSSLLSCRKDVFDFEKEPEYLVYPNPFSSEFKVKSYNSGTFNLTIYDKLGKVIFEKNNFKFGIQTFDLSTIDPGI